MRMIDLTPPLSVSLTGLMPDALSSLKAKLPDLHIGLRPGLTHTLLVDLERGELDAAIVSQPGELQSGLCWRPIAEEPMELLASSEVSQTDPKRILSAHPFIRFSRRAIVSRLIDRWLQKAGIRVNQSMELENLESIYGMVHANLGVSIVPKRCVSPPNPLPLRHLSGRLRNL